MASRAGVRRRGFRVLVATDGSPSARGALATALAFPWPGGTRVRGVVVSPRTVPPALAGEARRVAAAARRRLAQRWPDAEVVTVTARPAEGVLREAARHATDVIVLGWRGHGTFRRLLAGSVSRSVVERGRAAVLVVRRPSRDVRRVVIGVDGSRNARRAVDLVALLAGEGVAVTVVRVVEPHGLPPARRLPRGVRAVAHREIGALNRALIRHAVRDVRAASARLGRARWKVRTEVLSGAPLAALLDVVDRTDADLLVVGARATGGLRRALLGSVAAGALNHSRVPVLVVR
jgi:nucleotide-binding universal stress UspA family protein